MSSVPILRVLTLFDSLISFPVKIISLRSGPPTQPAQPAPTHGGGGLSFQTFA
jgi:hypothetical protein